MLADRADADLTTTLHDGPEALYALLSSRLGRHPGFGLLTVLAPNRSGDMLIRLFSSNTGQYPLGDADPVQDDRWFRRLFVERRPVVANDPLEIGNWLPDYTEFVEMGYASLLNMPVVIAGESIGVMNVMGGPGHFSQAAVSAIAAETPLAALAILGRGDGFRRLELPAGR